MKFEKKVQNLNKRYENRIKGTTLEWKVQNRRAGTKFQWKYAKLRNETFFQFCETTRNILFRISRNNRNSAKQWPVSYSFEIRETEKYETVNPTRVRNNSSRVTNNSSRARQTILPMWQIILAVKQIILVRPIPLIQALLYVRGSTEEELYGLQQPGLQLLICQVSLLKWRSNIRIGQPNICLSIYFLTVYWYNVNYRLIRLETFQVVNY